MTAARISKKAMKLAEAYAALAPEAEYPDMNAAILLAKALLRVCKQVKGNSHRG